MNSGFGKQDRLEIWKLDESGVNKVLQWIPYDDQQGGQRDVKWASFLADNKLVTTSNGGKLAVWNAATAEPLFWLQIAGNCTPALSPDRKYVAFATDKEMGLLDVPRGRSRRARADSERAHDESGLCVYAQGHAIGMRRDGSSLCLRRGDRGPLS